MMAFITWVVWSGSMLVWTLAFWAFGRPITVSPKACRTVLSQGSLRNRGQPLKVPFALNQKGKHLELIEKVVGDKHLKCISIIEIFCCFFLMCGLM